MKGISFRRNGTVVHNDESTPLTSEQLDALPFVTESTSSDLDYLSYNSPYCQYPYVSLYTGRGCPGALHVLPVAAGDDRPHLPRAQRRNVIEEVSQMKRRFPKMKELFFDDDTFTADPPRAREIANGLGSSASPGRPTRAPTSTARRWRF